MEFAVLRCGKLASSWLSWQVFFGSRFGSIQRVGIQVLVCGRRTSIMSMAGLMGTSGVPEQSRAPPEYVNAAIRMRFEPQRSIYHRFGKDCEGVIMQQCIDELYLA